MKITDQNLLDDWRKGRTVETIALAHARISELVDRIDALERQIQRMQMNSRYSPTGDT